MQGVTNNKKTKKRGEIIKAKIEQRNEPTKSNNI